MSDLQCAATVVVVDTAADGEALRPRRPVVVCAAPGTGDTVAALARLLDAGHRDLPGAPISPDGLLSAIGDIADEYRGECVAVVVTPTALIDLVRRVLPDHAAAAVVVEVDADGQRWAPLSDARAR
ncbi:hypothetical protein SAMN05216184_11718 [Georgenia satyanarayanai]|uniref:Uncharacterized protein n=1 Tax=Georgenia satyanarayanai TaxID=860221 RepID=A0A2Y9AQQ3_9MICO|nr:hypothetical protein [Georgenia satyanarayanai]PYF96800.1 hypothetical protein A8987_11718 [Georgenia satyanarayanai]SSA46396.1 hypothetical protein SAMN05216184_11718 [Georgenia satyanarayanai]